MREWFRAYTLLLRWRVLQSIGFLPIALVLQTILAGASVLGFALLIPHIDAVAARYLATGGPTIALMAVGLVAIPQSAAQEHSRDAGDYMSTLPVPRLAELASQLTVFLTLAIPGMLGGLIVSKLRFGFALHPSPLVVPAILVVSLTATSLGYAIALVVRQPILVTLATNLVLFGAMLFSPINYPPERLPHWLARVHEVLPIAPMAQLVRSSLTGADRPGVRALATIALWCVASLATVSVIARRRT